MATLTEAQGIDRRKTVWAIWVCFFASGMSGLIYQVVWVRELVLVFGATTFAVSTVLTAFMGGLALGSYYFGRRSHHFKKPLKVYGVIEIGIGLYGLLVPLIFAALPVIYQPFWERLHVSFIALSAARFLFAALVLILPTALMGATLPVLSNYYARERDRIGLRVGFLYSLNTFGAVLGASITGFVLIPMLGMRASTVAAASINILLGILALAVSKTEERAAPDPMDSNPDEARPEEPKRKRAARGRLERKVERRARVETSERLGRAEVIATLAAFALSGFIALSLRSDLEPRAGADNRLVGLRLQHNADDVFDRPGCGSLARLALRRPHRHAGARLRADRDRHRRVVARRRVHLQRPALHLRRALPLAGGDGFRRPAFRAVPGRDVGDDRARR